MNRCPACGAVYGDDASFCSLDGTRLLPATESTSSERATSSCFRAPERFVMGAGSAHVDLAGQTLEGRYAIARKIGEGGMSFVYLATDTTTGQPCAIKVLSGGLSRDDNAMERLRREAAFGMRLAHPNVCHIMHLGETDDGLVFVVMPYVDGELLVARINRLGKIPLGDTVDFVRDIAAGLHVAHRLGIVHRDLKPENVMICSPSRSGGRERAVVMDFGLAKERRLDGELGRLTKTGVVLGTPEFMSPEQLRGRPVDPRTDIYALGLVAFEMLSGELPFAGNTQQEIMMARLRSEPSPLRTICGAEELPEAVEDVLAKALVREPDERYQTTLDLADALADAASASA
jgi:eukaryotic-like serine/threonine-protein kinase